MASQIAHIVYAKKFLENDHPNWIDKDEFLLGSIFPDIRYIDKSISRHDTHRLFKEINLDFSGLSSFEAGWKFHLYCDMKREEILTKYNFFEIPGADKFQGRSAKLLEEKMIYAKYNNWEKLCILMNNIPYFETGINVSRETFEHWYAIIANYVKQIPDYKTMHIFVSKVMKNGKEVDEIIQGLKELEKNEKATAILGKVWKEII